MGDDDDPKNKHTSEEFIYRISVVDAVLDGHTYRVNNKKYKNKTGKEIIVTQNGQNFII